MNFFSKIPAFFFNQSWLFVSREVKILVQFCVERQTLKKLTSEKTTICKLVSHLRQNCSLPSWWCKKSWQELSGKNVFENQKFHHYKQIVIFWIAIIATKRQNCWFCNPIVFHKWKLVHSIFKIFRSCSARFWRKEKFGKLLWSKRPELRSGILGHWQKRAATLIRRNKQHVFPRKICGT